MYVAFSNISISTQAFPIHGEAQNFVRIEQTFDLWWPTRASQQQHSHLVKPLETNWCLCWGTVTCRRSFVQSLVVPLCRPWHSVEIQYC